MAEDEGLRHIRGLLATSGTEEQWAYLPDRRTWIEIGINEVGPQVEIDVDYLKRIIASSDRVHLYHFHPAVYFQPESSGTIALALPSPADVASSVAIAKLHETLNPVADVRNFVVSLYGVVEYAPTPLGRLRMLAEETHPRASIERDLLTRAAIWRSDFSVSRILAGAPAAAPSDIIATLCARFTNAFYGMHYLPWSVTEARAPAGKGADGTAPAP
jgi:hypothetical protein